MTQAETIIILLLVVIAYFLYQIAKQLSFLTGRKLKFRLPNLSLERFFPKRQMKSEKEHPTPKLPN